MIGVSPSTPMYLYSFATDMRKSFNGLCGLVINEMHRVPDSGSLFIFVNREQTRMKILFWDRHGFWLFYKRLETGRFQLPKPVDGNQEVGIKYEQLVMILEGIDISTIKRRKRFAKKAA
jgi:transposase